MGVRRCFVYRSTSHLRAQCSARQPRPTPPRQRLRERNHYVAAGKRQYPVGAGRPAGDELSSVEPVGGIIQQGPSPKRSELFNTECECKRGLLVVEAAVKGFEKTWIILIDSGASGNYARRSTLEGSQLYAAALHARRGDTVTVRLATETHVTVPKVLVD